MDNNEPKQRMDRKAQARLRSLGKIFTRVMVAICALLIVAEFALHRHGEVGIDDNILFPAFFGFLAFVVIVFVGWGLRFLISRREDYYD